MNKMNILLIVALSAPLPVTQVLAGDGVVLIRRDVQPRVATRTELVPDPNPTVVSTSPEATLRALAPRAEQAGPEISDQEFSRITSGVPVRASAVSDSLARGGLETRLDSRAPGAAVGQAASHAGGGATRGISGQINRSLGQGLRPLQTLGR